MNKKSLVYSRLYRQQMCQQMFDSSETNSVSCCHALSVIMKEDSVDMKMKHVFGAMFWL